MSHVLQNIVDALSLGSILALVALGVGLIFSIMRLVNFAQGNYVALCAFAMLVPAGEGVSRVFLGNLPGFLLVSLVIGLGVLFAILTEILLFRHMRNANPATMMIASFALGSGLQNLLLMLFGSRPIALDLWPALMRPVSMAGVNIARIDLVIILVTAVTLASLTLFLSKTRLGTAMRASAENLLMARMLGIPADRIMLAAFGISGALAAMATLLLLPKTGLADIRMADGIILTAFVATVVGGLGSLPGAVAGAYLIGFISVGLQILLPVEARPFRDAFVYFLVILILLFKPEGIFASGARNERI